VNADTFPSSAPSDNHEPGLATLVDVCRRHAEDRATRSAYRWLENGEDEGASLTFGRLDRKARAIAARLQALGLDAPRVLVLHSGLDFVCAFLGCLYAGGAAVPAAAPRRHQSVDGLLRIASDARIDAVLAPAAMKEAMEAGGLLGGWLAQVPWIAAEAIDERDAAQWVVQNVEPDRLALLQYTSGSTGAPKGVEVSHANLLHNQAMIARAFGHSESTVFVGWLPLHHDMGLIGNVLQPLFLGIPCVLMAPEAFVQKPVRWLEAITRYRATTSGAPNFAYDLCARRVPAERRAALDLRSWQVAYNGAEPIQADTLERFAETFEPCGFRYESFYPCYGMAEATLFVTGGRSDEPPAVTAWDDSALTEHRASSVLPGANHARRLVGCGRPWLGCRVEIVDPESLERCPRDRVGEIWLAGPSIASGYLNQPELSAEVFGAELANGEGPFLRTGDLGFLRENQLFVTGRRKDLIIIRGRNHYPHDIERTVWASNPALRRGCGVAIGVESSSEEQLVVIQEVREAARHEAPTALPALEDGIREAVSRQHGLRVHDVVIVPTGTIPKTSSGKLRRLEMRAAYIAGTLSRLDTGTFG
jgi:acyl-CoA synthetase (AMP-forming)/AMP-acid ligase II